MRMRIKYTNTDLINAVKTSYCMRDVLRKIGMSGNGGGSVRRIKEEIFQLKLDMSHFTGRGHLKGKTHNWSRSKNLEDVLVVNSTYSRHTLKNRLLKNGMLRNECYICGHKSEWHGKTLVMVIDHINGIYNDNRIENLRMLCPNCNSQQPTFCGRIWGYKKDAKERIKQRTIYREAKRVSKKRKCDYCRQEYIWNADKDKFCSQACYRLAERKVQCRPTMDELKIDLHNMSMVKIGAKYGVSDSAIRKWAKQYGILSERKIKHGHVA